jgi:signal transduction histidine kinase
MDNCKSDQSKKYDQKKHLQDISLLLEVNQEMEKKYKQATSELNLLKDRLQKLNHDLRGPLGGITGMLDLMIIKYEERLEVQTHDLIMIRESAQSLLDLVISMPLARDNQISLNGSMNIDRKLSTALKEVNRLHLPMAQNKGASLSLSNQTDVEIMLSPNFFINLIQIIGNLVANAIKFTSPGGSVDVVFTMVDEKGRTVLNVTVSDTGKGMSPIQISAFNRGKPVTRSVGTNGEESFGIGLQHVKKMVSEFDGHIVLKSEIGTGTIFSLTFPLSDHNITRESTALSAATNGILPFNGSQS